MNNQFPNDKSDKSQEATVTDPTTVYQGAESSSIQSATSPFVKPLHAIEPTDGETPASLNPEHLDLLDVFEPEYRQDF